MNVFDEMKKQLKNAKVKENDRYRTYGELIAKTWTFDRKLVEELSDSDLLDCNKFKRYIKFTPMGRHIYMQRLRGLEDDN